jgi:hypothetical protein
MRMRRQSRKKMHERMANGVAQTSIYKSKLDKIVRYIRLHKALSTFRKTLTEQLEDETISNYEKPTIDAELLRKFWYVFIHNQRDGMSDSNVELH